jgi:biotin carboxylase
MRVLFLAPDTHVYNHAFVRGLRGAGAQVCGIGPAARPSAAVAELLDDYSACPNILSTDALLVAQQKLGNFDRVETIDEPLVEAAASLRQALDLPGLTVETARLCRDKVAMKDLLRREGVPCAAAARIHTMTEALEFVEREGFPVVVKPVAGFGSLQTHVAKDTAQLRNVLAVMRPSAERPVAVEEFIEGHEGFYDTITDDTGIRHDFAAHYYPGCLAANQDRRIAPQIAVTNRIDEQGYEELRQVGRRTIEILGLHGTATHMEWFFGPKGLKFSEIGARPAGEKIWDMYSRGNEFDVYAEWARAVIGQPTRERPSRRYAVGHVQVRPDRDGTYRGHSGLEEAFRRCGPHSYEHEVPQPGSRTRGLEKGWHVNTWFRLRHENYDTLRQMMTHIGNTVRAFAG